MLRHRTASVAAAIVGSTLLSGCGSVGYLAQAARGQWQVLQRRQPIERVLAQPSIDAKLAAQLRLAWAARDFATRSLGLPDNNSYRSYSALGRSFVVWNVVAAPAYAIEPLHWCFPVAGCTSYRGYFRERAARRYAARLQTRGYDVLVAGVPAYSTLGHFADPVLDTMLRHGDDYVIATVFHELAHQQYYLKGDSDFNEAFATVVEQVGMERWYRAHEQSRELADFQARQELQAKIARSMARARAALSALYRASSTASPAAGKKQLLAELGDSIRALERQSGLRAGYDDWLALGLNNAHLAAVATYYDCVPGFRALLASLDDDLPRYYVAVRELARQSPAQRKALCHPPA